MILDTANLQIGTIYRVILKDCCIEGWFEDELLSINLDDGDPVSLIFKHGYLDNFLAVTFEEISDAVLDS